MRARVSSHIFLMRSPLRPMMLPTLRTGTISRNTQSPGQPGHFLSADGDSDSKSGFIGSDSGSGSGSVAVVAVGASDGTV